jgi:restriction system protein
MFPLGIHGNLGFGLQGMTIFKNSPELLLQCLIEPSKETSEGTLVQSVSAPWIRILKEIQHDSNFLMQFLGHPRKFEEFIAGVYSAQGFDVMLTSRSKDGGRDVIASKQGFGSVRFLEQVKCYKPGHLVTHDDVRAMLGVLSAEQPRASKALITTTSDFQPTIMTCDQFKPFIPYQLELKNGEKTLQWLQSIDPVTLSKSKI